MVCAPGEQGRGGGGEGGVPGEQAWRGGSEGGVPGEQGRGAGRAVCAPGEQAWWGGGEGGAALGYVRDGVRTRRIPRCPGCWLHAASCVCAELPRLSAATRVVVVMHHVELRRASNTGRLAARVLGAEVRVRGLPGARGAEDWQGAEGREADAGAGGGASGQGLAGTRAGAGAGAGASVQGLAGAGARAGAGAGASGQGLAGAGAAEEAIVADQGRRLVLFPGEHSRVLTPDDAAGGALTLVVPDGSWKQASRAVQRDAAAAGAEVVALPPGPPSRYRLRRRAHDHALCTYEAIARALAILEGPAIEAEMMRGLELFVERTLALRGGVAAAGYDE